MAEIQIDNFTAEFCLFPNLANRCIVPVLTWFKPSSHWLPESSATFDSSQQQILVAAVFVTIDVSLNRFAFARHLQHLSLKDLSKMIGETILNFVDVDFATEELL